MSKLRIEIDLNTEAFDGDKRGAELSSILETVAFTIRDENEEFEHIGMYDSHDNYVGLAEILDDE